MPQSNVISLSDYRARATRRELSRLTGIGEDELRVDDTAVVSLADRARRDAAVEDAALVASYVADYRAGLACSDPETAFLWSLADAVEELIETSAGNRAALAALLQREVLRRMEDNGD